MGCKNQTNKTVNVDSGSDCEVDPASEMAAKSDILSQGRSFPAVSAIDRDGYLNVQEKNLLHVCLYYKIPC